ncbi:MAG TPA: hypothetical protein VLX44_20940 [Xanthobacteraceae bacterium]|nr:hypothetical protein [Xanthobacteraceae bacterium]
MLDLARTAQNILDDPTKAVGDVAEVECAQREQCLRAIFARDDANDPFPGCSREIRCPSRRGPEADPQIITLPVSMARICADGDISSRRHPKATREADGKRVLMIDRSFPIRVRSAEMAHLRSNGPCASSDIGTCVGSIATTKLELR